MITARIRTSVLAGGLCVCAGCAAASRPANPAPFPQPPAAAHGPARSTPATRPATPADAPIRTSTTGDPLAAVIETALDLRGTPYRFGGTTPESGFDCSGFVAYVFGMHGIQVPRSVAEQYEAGVSVRADRLRNGDLVFFTTIGPGATHVGIVTDAAQGLFAHSPSDGSTVRVDRLDNAYWRARLIGVRRLF
jgi:cell wall-associated NlpC family hydrolase